MVRFEGFQTEEKSDVNHHVVPRADNDQKTDINTAEEDEFQAAASNEDNG